MMRPDIDTYFMLMAKTAALRGTCSRRYVGAVAVDGQNRVHGTGYNGAPPGVPHCSHVLTSEPCLIAEHAEWNAIVHGGARGHTMYCTDSPCVRCAELIMHVGFKRVVYERPFRDLSGLASLSVNVERWSCPPEWQALWSSLDKATSSYTQEAQSRA